MAISICKEHPHLKAVSADLGQLVPVFKEYIEKEDPDIKERVSFRTLDFFKEGLPTDVDAILFGHILHDWPDEIKKMLIKKTYDALPKGGHIIIYEYFLDHAEGKPPKTEGYMMSIHMQLACTGSQFTKKEMAGYLTEAGFGDVQFHELDHYNEVAVATKL